MKKQPKNTKKKRILFIGQLPPPIHGVSAMNSYLVNSRLIRANYDLEIVNLQFAKSIQVIAKFSFSKLWKAIVLGLEIVRKILLCRPHLVYFTIAPSGFAFYRDAYYVLLIKLLKKKIIFHLHSQGIRRHANSSRLKKKIYSAVFKNTSVICLSESLIKDIRDVYDQRPFIVPNGIQPINTCMEEKQGKNNELPQIFYLSNFIKSKGVLVLLEALTILKKQGYAFRASLVGAPGDFSFSDLEDIIDRQGMAAEVKVVGPLYGEEKFRALKAADMFVFPTYNDAFPLVNIEAMQCGLPVISTYEGGIPDIVEHNESGYLVRKRDPEMLAEKIAVLLSDSNLRTEMGKRGYKKFVEQFTIDRFEKKMNQTFQEILTHA